MEPIHIADIQKNKSEIIRVEITEYNGRKLVNVRTWYLNDEQTYAPTKKGVAFSLEQLDKVLTALEKAKSIIDEKFTAEENN